MTPQRTTAHSTTPQNSFSDQLERMARAFAARPASAQDRTATRATLGCGFRVETREGDTRLLADMPEAVGGSGAGPTPGVYGRACLAACIAIGLRITAERRKLRLDGVTVDLEMDWDSRGLFGAEGVSPGPANITLTLELDCDAPRATLDDLVAEALRNDPWLVALTRPHAITTRLVTGAGA